MFRLLVSDPRHLELGFTFIRIAVGVIFMIHGWGKFTGGLATWQWMGSQMAHLGITFWPTFWGVLAMLTELGGGFFLVLGLGTRFVSAALVFMMIVAMSYHLTKGDTFNDVWSHACTLMFVFIGFVIAGSGRYSLDHLLAKKYGVEVRK